MRIAFGVGRLFAVATVMLAAPGQLSRSIAAVQTTTTTYQYNADHALTAATTTINGQSTTVYFTWDNCVPSATTPSSCTVSAGNGNLLGVGAAPGAGDALHFGFDQRNRLISAAAGGAQSVTYAYHPASLLATSTLASGDALAFTYDTSPLPQMTNIQQSTTGTWASYLGDTTYLSDGTEQVLCQPRKDVAGLYEAAAGSLTPLRYDPYGSVESASSGVSSPATGAASYDMSQSPFRYAGEYADPAWGGVYLRARWYLPEYQTFLGRDPVDTIHRFGYGGGDPVGNVDPSGLSFDKFLRSQTSGKMAWATPLIPVWGQFVGGASLLAHLPELWHHPSSTTWASYGFLAVSAALESAGEFSWMDRALGSAAAFRVRGATDIFAGMSQALLGNYSEQKNKWDVAGLVQSVEYTVGGMFWSRATAGIGYRPFALSTSDVDEMTNKHFMSGKREDRAFVYRVRFKQYALSSTSPVLEWAGLGPYHEAVLVVGEQDLMLAHLSNETGLQYKSEVIWRSRDQLVSKFLDSDRVNPQFDLVAQSNEPLVVGKVWQEHDTGLQREVEDESRGSNRSRRVRYGGGMTNNCHHYAGRIVGRINGSGRY